MLPSRCAGIGSPGATTSPPYLLRELRAHMAVEGFVERPHLVPQAVELGGEGVGIHVVLAAPHRPQIGETELAGTLVAELYVALEVPVHLGRESAPALPYVEQLGGVAAGGEHAADGGDVEALHSGALGAVLACP